MHLFFIKYAHKYAQKIRQICNYILKYANKYAFIFYINSTLILQNKYKFFKQISIY